MGALPLAPAPPPPPPRPAPAPLRAAVDAATSALRATARAPPLAGLPTDGAGVGPDAAAVAAALTADYGRAYFVTGDIDGRAYAPDCVFADPTVEFTGLAAWRSNVALLTPWLASPSIDLEAPLALDGPHAVVAEWRLTAPIGRLPWRPVVRVRGVTRYTLAPRAGPDGRDPLIVRHEEVWRVPAWRAVAQLVVPGGGGEDGGEG